MSGHMPGRLLEERDMHRPLRTARAIALPRPRAALAAEWLVAGVAVVLLLAGLLAQ